MPAQLWLGQQQLQEQGAQYGLGIQEVFWWRTYSPPIWLLGGKDITTTDLMGMKAEDMMERVKGALEKRQDVRPKSVGLVAPSSSVELDKWIQTSRSRRQLSFERVWIVKNHLNLDDIDLESDGIRGTLARVVGRRGLVIWKVTNIADQ